MTTHEAFTELTSERGWYKKCGLESANQASSIKHLYKGGKLSIDKIYHLLEKAGYISTVDWIRKL
jgi:hypothetical protein